MSGKFFSIRSQLNSLVLDVQDCQAVPGNPVSPYEFNGGDNQLWYEDHSAGVIRSKLNDDMVLEVMGDMLTINVFNPDEFMQKWCVAGNMIQHREDPNQVLDIADHCCDPGARVCTYAPNGGPNQMWDIVYMPPIFCYIVSQLHGKVLDVRDGNPDAGEKAIMWGKHDSLKDNQLWYEDEMGYIHSKLNDFVLDTSEGSLRLNPHDPQIPGQQWSRSGYRIAHNQNANSTIEIGGADTWDGAKLYCADYKGTPEQLFKFEYLEI